MNTTDIHNIIKKELPTAFVDVRTYKDFTGNENIGVDIARSDYKINGLDRQYVEHCSFRISNWKLDFMAFGWHGWNYIYRNVDPNNPKEKYNALGTEKIKPKNFKSLEKYIIDICKQYRLIIVDIEARWLHRYQD